MAKILRTQSQRARSAERPTERLPDIQSVEVQGLFGRYKFPPLVISSQEREHPNLAFLYGENGVGKTTILRLLYSLLSSERHGGHRTTLANTKFLAFGVTFTDGQTIRVSKDEDQLTGRYYYDFNGPRYTDRIFVGVSSSGKVNSDVFSDADSDRLCIMLEKLCPTLVFVNDHRTIRSTYLPWNVRSYLNDHFRGGHRYTSDGVYVRGATPFDADVDSIASVGLDWLLSQTHNLFVERAIRGNARANFGIGQVYLQVARTISRSDGTSPRSDIEAARTFQQRINSVAAFMKEFGQFEVVQGDYIHEIARLVANSSDVHRYQLLEVLEPYLSSIEKRIETNRALVEQMAAFENGVNAFLRRKRLICRLDRPIQFVDDENNLIDQKDLSSGERHLIYLFCASMLSRERQSIIMVDEPELSLNYKWQRLLVDSLLQTAGNSAQFIMATHSFEIISKYRDAALNLEPVQ